MAACSSCGYDPGFTAAVCPRCGAGAGAAAAPRGPAARPDALTVLEGEATNIGAAPAGSAIGCFLVLEGPDKGSKYLIATTGDVGRAGDCAVNLRDSRVSQRHAQVKVHEGRVVYQDLEATNGTFLLLGGRRQRLRGPHVILDGDQLALGSTVLRYVEFARGGTQ